MIIYLVRHTKYHNPDNIYPFHLPLNLSSEGRKHASLIAEWFKKNSPPELPIFSSPIARCVQTSEIIASKTKSIISIDDRLSESYCPGLQGKKQPKKNAWKLEEDEPTREPKESVLKRALSIFNEKVKGGKDCIFVSHGDPTTVLYYHLRNKALPRYPWDPANSKEVVNKGSTIKVRIKDNKVVDIIKITDYSNRSS